MAIENIMRAIFYALMISGTAQTGDAMETNKDSDFIYESLAMLKEKASTN